jgi:rhodanese-related sulfurtransferase
MPRPSKRTLKTGKTGVTSRSRTSKSIRTVWMVALILIAIIGIGFLIVQIAGELAPWQLSDEISPDQARKQIGSGAIILDVRTYEEYVGGHIEKSLFMPLEDLTSLMAALPKDRLIIAVCRSGVRSIQARYILQDAGFTQVTSLTGGMEAWIAAGFPLVYGEPVRNN